MPCIYIFSVFEIIISFYGATIMMYGYNWYFRKDPVLAFAKMSTFRVLLETTSSGLSFLCPVYLWRGSRIDSSRYGCGNLWTSCDSTKTAWGLKGFMTVCRYSVGGNCCVCLCYSAVEWPPSYFAGGNIGIWQQFSIHPTKFCVFIWCSTKARGWCLMVLRMSIMRPVFPVYDFPR